MSSFKKGDTVRFRAGPRSTFDTVAKVTREAFTSGAGRGSATFLETTDDAGVIRKVRPGACSPA